MVTMSNVWDRTTEVLHGRLGMLVQIAVLALFLPGVVRDAVTFSLLPGSVTFAAVGGIVSIVVTILAIWGQLALVAVATDPATTTGDATRQASARLPAMLGVTIVLVLAFVALTVPPIAAIVASGADLSALTTTGTTTGAMPQIGGGTITFVSLYVLALLIVGIAVTARLVLINPVVLNDRLALGAFRRSWALTSGLTWRIIGVFLLYIIVVAVAVSAAQFITGAVFGLLLDDVKVTAFLAAAVAGVVTTILSVAAAAFTAQLYVAVTRRGVATVFE